MLAATVVSVSVSCRRLLDPVQRLKEFGFSCASLNVIYTYTQVSRTESLLVLAILHPPSLGWIRDARPIVFESHPAALRPAVLLVVGGHD